MSSRRPETQRARARLAADMVLLMLKVVDRFVDQIGKWTVINDLTRPPAARVRATPGEALW